MKRSTFNHAVSLSSDSHALVNTLSGAIDIVTNEVLANFRDGNSKISLELTDYLRKRGYLLGEGVDELSLVEGLYEQMLAKGREHTRLHCIFLVSFRCNLRCQYCWQRQNLNAIGLKTTDTSITLAKAEKAFAAIASLREEVTSDRQQPPSIQLFGGEPLLPENRPILEHILKTSYDLHWPTHITTNGVGLTSYLGLIEEYGVKEVQVTIDGPSEIHNRRRVGSDYDSLMNALDGAIRRENVLVKMRVNVDLSNVQSLPTLARDILSRHWYASPYFFAYLAPLRDSGANGFPLMERRSEVLRAVLDLLERTPEVEIFDLVGWDGYAPILHLSRTGRFPFPRVNICEANLNQFVFTPTGEIHVCAEVAHASSNKVGDYWPRYSLDQRSFRKWYDNSPLKVSRCRECALLPICGRGCQLWEDDDARTHRYCEMVHECFDVGLAKAFERGELQ